MLVLTRRPSEKITFPSLGITIQLLGVNSRSARIGVEAPPEVRILRHELDPAAAETPWTPPAPRISDHALCNALSKVTLGVHFAQKLWQAGRAAEAEQALAVAMEALSGLNEARTAAKTARCRTMIVDDDANERALLAGILGMNGCECTTASDGAEAIAQLDAGARPHVVLLDMAMPGMNGPETLRRIRADERYGKIPVFSVSSTSPRELNIPVGPIGVDAWFPKPLDPRRLWDAIQDKVLSTHASDRA